MGKTEKLSLGAVAVALLTIGTIFDLQISQAVYNQENLFGRFFEAFGELPGVLVALFSIAALIVTMPKPFNFKRYLALAGLSFLLLSFGFMGGAMPMKYIGGGNVLIIILSVAFIIGALYLARLVPVRYHRALRRAATIGLLAFVAAILIITFIKFGWGRPRFRMMTDPAAQFTAWYLPQGLAAGNEYMSFPSGHSANSSVILWITLLPLFVPSLEKKAGLLKAVAYSWIALVMFSRVIMGAHFVSDVTMGALISICSFYCLCHFIKEKPMDSM